MNWNKKTIIYIAFIIGIALAGGVGAVFAAHSVDHYGIVELEGDAYDNPADPGDDWSTLNNGGGNAYAKVFVTDPFNDGTDNIYTGGKTKDVWDFDEWKWTYGIPNDKSDIEHAYAAAYAYDNNTPGDKSDDELVIFAGLDRFARDGSANAGFWFGQESVLPQGDGTFGPGMHKFGDILVVIAFTQGGDVSNADVYKWVGGKNPLQSLVSVAGANCNGTGTACAYSNTETIPLYWSFTTKPPAPECVGIDNCAPQGSFVEVGINLSRILPADEPLPCFTTFIAETRTSHEENSTLKDFAYGEFNICELSITKACDSQDINSDDSGFTWEYSGTVTNKGFGTVYGARIIDSGPNQTIDTPEYGTRAEDDLEIILGPIDRLATVPFSVQFDTLYPDGANPSVNVARVEAALSEGGDLAISSLSNVAECLKISRSPDLSVDKDCSLRLEPLNDKVVAVVDISGKVCNTGDVKLTNVQVINDMGTESESDDVAVPLSAQELDPPGTEGGTICATYSDSYYPTHIIGGDPGVPCGSSFGDNVHAYGTAILGLGEAEPAMATATCPMCPDHCVECTTATTP